MDGQIINKGKVLKEVYEIGDLIGKGEMSEVYRAYHKFMKREVAVKVVYPELVLTDPTLIKRFISEAQISFDLNHKNIVSIYDVGEENGITFMVMEYIDGEVLSNQLKVTSALSVEQKIGILEGIGSALDYAHEVGFVHRNVKTSKIMIRKSDATPILMDFGIAKAASSEALTRYGFEIRSAEYMSPEQAKGEAATPLSDLYSLGVIAYEMFAGNVPFRGSSSAVTLLQHMTHDVPPISEINSNVPRNVDKAILKMLSKEPENRFQSAASFISAMKSSSGFVSPESKPEIRTKHDATPPPVKKKKAKEHDYQPSQIAHPKTGKSETDKPIVAKQSKARDSSKKPEKRVKGDTPVQKPVNRAATPIHTHEDRKRKKVITFLCVVLVFLVIACGLLIYKLVNGTVPERDIIVVPKEGVKVEPQLMLGGNVNLYDYFTTIKPSEIKISGTLEIINDIDSIYTETIDLRNIGIEDWKEPKTYALVLPGNTNPGDVDIEPSEVEVTIKITQKPNETISMKIPIKLIRRHDDYDYKVSPENLEVAVNITGPPFEIKNLRESQELAALLPVGAFPEGYTGSVHPELPELGESITIELSPNENVTLEVKKKSN